MSISLNNLNKSFGDFAAVRDVSLEIPSGELVALLGPSGSGKTTLLRIIAGLEAPDSGTISFHGEDTTNQHVRERRVGFVFQHYALFRHMSVFENVAFGLRVRPKTARPPEKEIQDRCMALLKLVQLDWLAQSYPNQLSGGQRQRVALARALAVEPKVLLLDEPFGALDAKVRKELRRWLRRLHDEIHVTSVFVTHDQEEALEVADQVVVMNEGRVEQVGTPTEVYDHPATPFVYSFLGNVNLFKGRLHAGGIHIGGQLMSPTEATEGEGSAVAYVRTHEIQLDVDSATGEGVIQATVSHIRAFGSLVRVDLEPVGGGEMIEAEVPRERFDALGLAKGAVVYVKPKRIKVFLEQ
ncbi:MAG TPA: sulfate ABC transporter ATP-binding protein [Gemmatimonadales bacterium]|jgi:sulfate transport system ATP-binding protein|nr:sulfate ABC transporter ATP-binding protein [Gemmatimonadales bacterium]